MPAPSIKIIALDLDGTLLNSQKVISPRNYAALERAAARGIEVVPTTGRFFDGMPECVRALPFLHYAITVNGAQLYDVRERKAIAKAELTPELAAALMSYLDREPVVYDCYQDNWGYMTQSFQEHIADYIANPDIINMVRQLRTPVPELKAYLLEKGQGVQKVQMFTMDLALRERLIAELTEKFPEAAVSSSASCNIEINAVAAQKGKALRQLADLLGVDMSRTVAFGDGMNDVSMLKAAGIGFAMGDAWPEALAAGDRVTAGCDEDGVAVALEQLGI